MKAFIPTLTLLLFAFAFSSWAGPRAGFFLPDSVQEVALRYKTLNGLIVLPVTINDKIHVNLILDTGCRNLILFGKRFEKLFPLHPGKKVEFSGLGSGKPIMGGLSLDNKVAIDAVLGERIPVVIIDDRNLFRNHPQIHGVIGYEVFSRFEIELNPASQQITFRPGASSSLPENYAHIELRIEDSRPILKGIVEYADGEKKEIDLMIDTGSTLGLLLKTTEQLIDGNIVVGRGLNGLLKGERKESKSIILESIQLAISSVDVVSSWNNYSTLGMEVLKEYSLIFNYSKSYAGLRRNFIQ
jgi:hypothetical protein